MGEVFWLTEMYLFSVHNLVNFNASKNPIFSHLFLFSKTTHNFSSPLTDLWFNQLTLLCDWAHNHTLSYKDILNFYLFIASTTFTFKNISCFPISSVWEKKKSFFFIHSSLSKEWGTITVLWWLHQHALAKQSCFPLHLQHRKWAGQCICQQVLNKRRGNII